MESMAKVVNLTPNSSIKVPCTKYLIKKYIPPKLSFEYHIKCVSCPNYITSIKSEVKCMFCEVVVKCSESDYFMTVPLEQQIEQMIDAHLENILAYNTSVLASIDITDLHNAKIYKNAQKAYPSSVILPLIVNTDGIKVFKSSSKSLWLIQMYQGYLPPSIRFIQNNVLILAAHFGEKKPRMMDFFYPILKELQKIIERGGIIHNKNGKTHNFMPLILSCCCDLPAKADVQGTVGHSGCYGCGYCLHPGILVKGNSKKAVRFINGNKNYEIRSHEHVLNVYKRLNTKPIQGIKNISCMIGANLFDLIHGFSLDTMHCVHLGVMKLLFKLWLNMENRLKPYFITKRKQIALSNLIVNIKPISEIIRKPRSLFKLGDFKANEFRSLLLYYLPIALVDLHHSKYVKHFRLLSSATYILSREKISLEDIEMANLKLNTFVDQFEDLYDKSSVTMNVHLLRHLPLAVSNLGPLWTQSAYGFESNNGMVTKSNNSTKDIVHQLIWKYVMKQTIKFTKTTEKMADFLIGGKKSIKLNADIAELLTREGLNKEHKRYLTVHQNLTVRGIKFTSMLSKEISTLDFFVKLNDGNIAAIEFFMTVDFDLYALVILYDVTDTLDHFLNIKQSKNKRIVKLKDISGKVLYLKFGQKEYTTTLTNKYEKT